MKAYKYILGIVLLMMVFTHWVSAQQNTVATGGEATGTGGSVSYTIGQIDYNAISDNDGLISEGVQQPYEIYITTSVDDHRIELSSLVFPNPAMDRLTLSIEQLPSVDLHFTLITIEGKLVKSGDINSPQHEIAVSDLPEGTYFLRVNSKKQLIKTFKIIKNRSL